MIITGKMPEKTKPSNVFLFPTGQRLHDGDAEYLFVTLQEMLKDLENVMNSFESL